MNWKTMLRNLSLIALCLTTACAGLENPAPLATVTVMAAASLNAPFQEIGALYQQRYPGTHVTFNFAGSQQLVQQLAQGAPADVFASANQKTMDDAVSANRVAKGAAQIFARNRLVVIYPKANPAGLQQLSDLAKPGLKLDFAAKEVPVGQYSLDFLDKATKDPAFTPTYKDAVLKNVVSYEDNVKAVLSKVALGEADGGIVYTTDITGDSASKVGRLDIPDALNVIAVYPIAPITGTTKAKLARNFIDLVVSQDGQAILARYGFLPPSP